MELPDFTIKQGNYTFPFGVALFLYAHEPRIVGVVNNGFKNTDIVQKIKNYLFTCSAMSKPMTSLSKSKRFIMGI